MMETALYALKDTHAMISPALIYYPEIIRENTRKAIEIAGDVSRLWPHVKSHKSAPMVKMQIELGISRFKCATIPEAEMVASVGAKHILLAYPLIGPNIQRYLSLAKAYPHSHFYAIGDDYAQLALLSQAAKEQSYPLDVLLDVNMGMNRTGVPLAQAQALYERCTSLQGIHLCGMHCYDGNHNNKDFTLRDREVGQADCQVAQIQKNLQAQGIDCKILIMGGTPAFPCHAHQTDWYLSPGTAFLTDWGYQSNLPDLHFVPGAAVFTRVISHSQRDIFTLDLGYKGIASDPAGLRGVIVGLPHVHPLFQSEEHWVFQMEEGYEQEIPPIGTGLYVIPTHICPTSALYHEIQVAQNGELVDIWPVTARDRKLTY